jgi:hypothetical protein
MPYRNYGGPEDYYGQDSGFDPYTGRLNGGQLVMQFLQRLQAEKDRKKQAGWDVEDREMNKRVKEAQIRNYDETTPVKAVEPKSDISPVMLKSIMKRLDYPEESILEVDTMNQPARAAAWAKAQGDFAARQLQGLKVPKTAASQKGKLQQAQLKAALDTVKSRGTRYNAALSQLYANPDKGMLVQDKIEQYEKMLDDIERQSGEIASMMNNIDETGELSEDQLRDLNLILKWKVTYRNTRRPIPGAATDAEKKLPPGFVIQK